MCCQWRWEMESMYVLKPELTVLAPLLMELSEKMERIKKKSKVSGWKKRCIGRGMDILKKEN